MVPNRESTELRWVAEHEVAGLPLHPGFAASWQSLRGCTYRAEPSVRFGRDSRVTPLGPGKRRKQRRGRRLRILGGGDRAHHHHPAGAGRRYLRQPLGIDPADGEPRLVGALVHGEPQQLQTRSGPAGLGGVGQHGPTQK